MKVITIGRGSDNDIVINDVKVSRNHLQIVQGDNGDCSVVDLESSNGTLVNGQKIVCETRLQSNDIVQIGSTTLPWQGYFVGQQQRPLVEAPDPKPKHTIWYIAVAMVLLLLAGGGIVLKIHNDRRYQVIEAENKSKAEEAERFQQEAAQKDAEAKQLQDEADRLYRKALISQSDMDKKLAEKKQQEANTAKNDAERARAAQKKAENERDVALNAQKKAEVESEKANAAKVAAEKEAADANKKKQELKKERDAAAEEARLLLQESFDENFPKLKSNKYYVRVAQRLALSSGGDAEVKAKIEQEFKKADNAGKKRIIDAIKIVLTGKGDEEKAAEEKAGAAAKTVEDSVSIQ